MRNELNNKKRFVWRCAVVLLALVCFGIWFVNQPKEDEVSTKRIVINERPKQEVKKEITVLKTEPEEQEPAALPRTKKKAIKSVKKAEIPEDFLVETTVGEDTITNVVEEATKFVESRPNRSIIFADYGTIPSLNISMGTYNHPEKNRNSETILKDAEALTRNGHYTYIVDGVRVSEETFRSLNQNDVESVDIYKHTDVYNARFGNKENQSRISLNAR